MWRLLSISFFLLLPITTCAQAIDNTLAYKQLQGDRFVRFNYENDYFSARDRFYTQGVVIEYAHPLLAKNPVNVLFPCFGDKAVYSISVEQDACTPTSIQADKILYGDRPYAASLLLKTTAISIDLIHRQRLSGSLAIGVVGAAAGGEQMQTTIHEHTGNIIPQGWQYQVHTDLALNYQLNYERELLSFRNFFSWNADVMVRAGSLSTKAEAGTTVMAGYFPGAFTTERGKLHIYAYDRLQAAIIGYDATLQGGLFNHSSPYVIPAGDVSRVCFGNRFGLVLSYKKLCVEYFQSWLTREFKTQADNHRWGGVQLAWVF